MMLIRLGRWCHDGYNYHDTLQSVYLDEMGKKDRFRHTFCYTQAKTRVSACSYYECIVVVVAYYYAPYIIKPISTLQRGLALFWDGNFSEGHCKPPFFNHLHRAKHAFPCVIVCCYQKLFVPFIWTHTAMAYKSFIKQINPQLSNLWWIPNSVSKGFDAAMKTGSSRRFKPYPTTYRWVSSWLPFTVD